MIPKTDIPVPSEYDAIRALTVSAVSRLTNLIANATDLAPEQEAYAHAQIAYMAAIESVADTAKNHN